MVECKPSAIRLQEEKEKIEKRSTLMRQESKRLLSKDLPCIEALKTESAETLVMLESLSKCMASIHSLTASLASDDEYGSDDDDAGDEFGGESADEGGAEDWIKTGLVPLERNSKRNYK